MNKYKAIPIVNIQTPLDNLRWMVLDGSQEIVEGSTGMTKARAEQLADELNKYKKK